MCQGGTAVHGMQASRFRPALRTCWEDGRCEERANDSGEGGEGSHRGVGLHHRLHADWLEQQASKPASEQASQRTSKQTYLQGGVNLLEQGRQQGLGRNVGQVLEHTCHGIGCSLPQTKYKHDNNDRCDKHWPTIFLESCTVKTASRRVVTNATRCAIVMRFSAGTMQSSSVSLCNLRDSDRSPRASPNRPQDTGGRRHSHAHVANTHVATTHVANTHVATAHVAYMHMHT